LDILQRKQVQIKGLKAFIVESGIDCFTKTVLLGFARVDGFALDAFV
jgi:hypothetical protein